MNWGSIFGVFLLATVKFMFAPFTGAGLDLTFLETILACASGGILSSSIFYLLSDFFIKRHREKLKTKQNHLIDSQPLSNRQRTKLVRKYKINRMIVRVKWSVGQWGICFLAPLFLSVPLGTIICAKFYNHKANTLGVIAIGLSVNSVALSLIAYLLF